VDREPTVQAAQSRAGNIIEQAKQEAEEVVAGADKYVAETLARLEQQLAKALNVVRNGINEVNTAGAVQPMPPAQFPVAMRQQVEVRKEEQ
jgi:F0F1-type ATP synthase membrane subunit b/b'